ncbi:S8/S53 family peptidase [Desulfobacterota bacterium AH_259_B03_O07]|nr:S8/S53 family peptidase [Desulfobacterota bacterium AH_259_B03_O07]
MRKLYSLLSLLLFLVTLIFACGPMRLIPDDYSPEDAAGNEMELNQEQLDVVKLPEAWYYMQEKWVSEKEEFGMLWPLVVVIDDGFLTINEFPRAMTNGPAYGDEGLMRGVLVGTSAGDGQHPNINCRGHHGTAVALILGGVSNNVRQPINPGAFRTVNISSVAGTWWHDNTDPNFPRKKWGIDMLPVRIDGNDVFSAGIGCGNVQSMTQALRYAAGNTPEYHLQGTYPIRVVNISKEIASLNNFAAVPDPDLESAFWTLTGKAIVVLASGNDKQVINQKGWLDGNTSVVIVGALNKAGNDYWEDPIQNKGTRRGSAIDIYAPGEDYLIYLPNAIGLQERLSGVSFAAPVVSGVLAMMWNANPCMSNSAHVRTLLNTADDITLPGGDVVRRLNAYRAVKQAYDDGAPTGSDPCPRYR